MSLKQQAGSWYCPSTSCKASVLSVGWHGFTSELVEKLAWNICASSAQPPAACVSGVAEAALLSLEDALQAGKVVPCPINTGLDMLVHAWYSDRHTPR